MRRQSLISDVKLTRKKYLYIISLFCRLCLLYPLLFILLLQKSLLDSLNPLLTGHTRRISIPGCVEFYIQTNACRGFCVSYSLPSLEAILKINSKHVISSFGHCCNIIEAEDVSSKRHFSLFLQQKTKQSCKRQILS